MSFTTTATESFTRTHARYIASKIGGDLRQLMRYYGQPAESEIEDYITEITEMLAARCLASFEAGFKRDGKRVVSLLYRVRSDGTVDDTGAGGVYARADISGGSWFTFRVTNATYDALSPVDRQALDDRIPVDRTPGSAPTDGAGYWVSDRSYAAGGTGAARQSFRPY